MDILNQVIGQMNKEDIRFFKLYASRFNVTGQRKDLMLFDYVKKTGNDYDEAKILKTLYQEQDKNAFYRLKNRLIEDLNKSLLIQHYDTDNITKIFHLLSLGRFYFNKNCFRLAFHYIRKAESKARELENYELLDFIYGELIKLSHELVSINPEVYIEKRKENRVQLNTIREIDDMLAVVHYRLKVTQNFSERENSVIAMLKETMANFSQNEVIKNSPKFRFKVYSAVSQVLLQKHDYAALEDYLLKTYAEFKKEGLFSRENHDSKLQMLIFLVNTLFKNKKLKLSLKYTAQLEKAMKEFNGMHYDKFLFFYYNSLVINYSVLDKDKAISILEELKRDKKLQSQSFYEIFVHLNLAILWFDKEQYQKAIKNLSHLYLHASYENADPVLKLKIAVAELIIGYELNDVDFFEHKWNSMKRMFKEALSKPEHTREKEFVQLIKRMFFSGNIKNDETLSADARAFMSRENPVLSESEIIKYNDWLSSKFKHF